MDVEGSPCCLKLGKYSILVSPEEFQRLEAVYRRYLEVHGTGLGFVYFLLDGGGK
jgi:hypothetical protein